MILLFSWKQLGQENDLWSFLTIYLHLLEHIDQENIPLRTIICVALLNEWPAKMHECDNVPEVWQSWGHSFTSIIAYFKRLREEKNI